MRISDWSSDVCSSDLALPVLFGILAHLHPFIASGDADQYAEHRRLDQHDPEIGHRDDLAQPLDIGERRDIEPDPAEEDAARERAQAGIKAEQDRKSVG